VYQKRVAGYEFRSWISIVGLLSLLPIHVASAQDIPTTPVPAAAAGYRIDHQLGVTTTIRASKPFDWNVGLRYSFER
jgi:hypothetical protein